MRISSNILDIGKHAICNCPLHNIIVEKENPVYYSIDDVLYKKLEGRKNCLVKYAPKKDGRRFCVDENTNMLDCCAFKHAGELEEIVLHESIFSLGEEQTFACCISLKQIRLPSGIKRIPKHTFVNCSSLEEVVLPSSESYSIEEEVFKYCKSLRSVHSPIEKIENIVINEKAFNGFDIDECTLYVPSGTRWIYRHHPGFGKFKNIEIEKKN